MRRFHQRRALEVAVVALALAGGQAMATETPKYEVVSRHAEFEVRAYGPAVVAETEIASDRGEATNAGFRRLAGYIFGGNRGSRKIAMTAPVAQTEGQRIAMTAPVAQTPGASAGSYLMNFTMPAEWTLESLPEPADARVHLRAVPARQMAVLTYSGTWSEERYLEHLEQLRAGLAREGLQAVGQPVWARYDPPWTLWFLRRNEVQIEVAPPPGRP